MRHRVDVKVLCHGLLQIWNVNLTISTDLREHTLFKPPIDNVTHLFVYVELEEDLGDLVHLTDRGERCDGLQGQITNLLFVVVEQLQDGVEDLVAVELGLVRITHQEAAYEQVE